MRHIIRRVLVILCLLFALLAAAVSLFGVLGGRGDGLTPRVRTFGGPTVREIVADVREGVGLPARRVLSAGEEARFAVKLAAALAAAEVNRILAAADPRRVLAAMDPRRILAAADPRRLRPRAPAAAPAPQVVPAAIPLSPRSDPRASEELSGDPGAGSAAVPRADSLAVPRIKTPEEVRIEGIVQQTFGEYFKEYTIRGKRMRIRMPFALNDEREGGRGYTQVFYRQGKGTPQQLWPYIDSILASKGFARYAGEIASPGEKAIVFSLAGRAYSVSRNRQLVDALGMDSYPGTPTRIFVRKGAAEVSEADVYNYLYAVATVGVDCSGFVYHVLESIAGSLGKNLDLAFSRSLRTAPREVRGRVGLWFFDPANGYTVAVPDRIDALRPGDLILFRGSDGRLKHSAAIQSIDLAGGVIRYVQSTDWALEPERGVHESLIRFDPARPGVSLRHYSVRWLQQVRPPFEGEEEPRDWLTDRDRYLWYTAAGGSLVVRMRFLSEAILQAEPRYYTPVPLERRARFEETARAAASRAEPGSAPEGRPE